MERKTLLGQPTIDQTRIKEFLLDYLPTIRMDLQRLPRVPSQQKRTQRSRAELRHFVSKRSSVSIADWPDQDPDLLTDIREQSPRSRSPRSMTLENLRTKHESAVRLQMHLFPFFSDTSVRSRRIDYIYVSHPRPWYKLNCISPWRTVTCLSKCQFSPTDNWGWSWFRNACNKGRTTIWCINLIEFFPFFFANPAYPMHNDSFENCIFLCKLNVIHLGRLNLHLQEFQLLWVK